MQVADVDVQYLACLAKTLGTTKRGLYLSNLLRFGHADFNTISVLANSWYRLLRRADGYKNPENHILNPGDQSQFVYILIAQTLRQQGVAMSDVTECKNALMSLMNFDRFDRGVQNRMTKCLLEANTQIKTHF